MTYLGIDGGGSKTTFLVVDDHDREIVRIQTGPSNWLSVGGDAAAKAIRDGVEQLKTASPDVVCGGFAGAGRPEGLAFYRSVLEPLLPKARVRVESDAAIAFAGAIGVKPGVLLIAGTGSIAIGRKVDGSMIRVGGWGPHFGDEGGGFWIGREAVRAALRGDFPSLASKLGLTSIEQVVASWGAGKIGVPEIAGLFPEVVSRWPSEPAAGILRSAARELRNLSELAVQRVGIPDCTRSAIGSVATHPLIRDLVGIKFADPIASPERGAIVLARTM
jgi:N-acetylglucosamine kinase-like BadF-type ATPase